MQFKWGYDLTTFFDKENTEGETQFKELLALFDLIEVPREGKDIPFQWKSSRLLLVAANNPLTGEYYRRDDRDPEKGYLSYVGIECDSEDLLEDFVKLFREKALDIKGESPHQREFI